MVSLKILRSSLKSYSPFKPCSLIMARRMEKMLLRSPDKSMTSRHMSILPLLLKSLSERHRTSTLLKRLTSSISK